MIVDTHVHFWDPSTLEYPWLAAAPPLQHAFLPADYSRVTGGAVERIVAVEANCAPRQNVCEAELFERLAASDPRIAGIVAYVAMTEPATRGPGFDALSACAHVRGVRHNIQGERPGFCLHDDFVDGVREAGVRGYTFDLCITPGQLGDAAALVERCAETRFVLDHCGKPRIRDGADAAWHEGIERLAAFDHVWCKISGLLTEAAPGWSAGDILPYARHVVDCFGVERVMYGSDWPVLTLGGAYGDWLGLMQALTADWEPAHARQFFHDNALTFYRI